MQSVVVRIIVDRENEIRAFQPEEYWDFKIKLKSHNDPLKFLGVLHSENGKKTALKSEGDALRVEEALKVNKKVVVNNIKKRERKQKPPLPFTTSTLQQSAYQTLGFTTQRTMRLAQQLYEGVNVKGKGQIGLVTYIRTDSTRLSDEAKDEAKVYIEDHYGSDYLGDTKTTKKKKNIQDAHEAIRPSSILNTPENLKASLEKDQYKLYKLIWERMLESQMKDALYNVTDVDIQSGNLLFKSKGETLKFSGFTIIQNQKSNKHIELPELILNEELELLDIIKEQKFTKPPSRYTEATLVKVLEEKGIGRPSTYAPTIATIKNRDYVETIEKQFHPTELGEIVTSLMKECFGDVVNVTFTAKMEEDLDAVASGGIDWVKLLDKFYIPFKKELEIAQENAQSVVIQDPESDEDCEICGRRMVIKKGRFGKFLACPGFPECKQTKPYHEKTGGICPECGGTLVKRLSKKGRTFYSCINYPECSYMNWDLPVEDKCPICNNTMFQKGLGKRKNVYCAKCSKET